MKKYVAAFKDDYQPLNRPYSQLTYLKQIYFSKSRYTERCSKQVSVVYTNLVCCMLNPKQIPVPCYSYELRVDPWVWKSNADTHDEVIFFVAPRQIPISILRWLGRRYHGNAAQLFVSLFLLFFCAASCARPRPLQGLAFSTNDKNCWFGTRGLPLNSVTWVQALYHRRKLIREV